jgi:beta-N-acetylhexosaminidase
MSYLEEKESIIDEKETIDVPTQPNKKITKDEISNFDKEGSKKERLQMFAKIFGILLTTILIPVILSTYQDTTTKWIKNLFSGKETNQVSATSTQGNLKSDEATLIKLNQLANNGKMINCEFSLGTNEQILLQQWGKPDYISKVGLIEYWDYKEHHITIGVYKSRMIDIRSVAPELLKLTLGQLKDTGKPDDEYDHMNLDQHFLVYNMGKYKLRMIFPKPTQQVPSPHLIKVSLVDLNYSN